VWDSKELFLRERHEVAYRELSTVLQHWVRKDSEEVEFVLKHGPDLVGNVDLVLHDPDRLGVAGILRGVRVEIGGQRIDGWRCDDTIVRVDDSEAAAGVAFGTLVTTIAGLHGREVTRSGDTLFVPLALAPFHADTLLPIGALAFHDVKVIVRFATSYLMHSLATLYCDQYVLESADRRRTVENLAFGIEQTRTSTGFRTAEGGGEASQVLHLDHPVTSLLFWGFDRATVTHVKLTLDGIPFYDGPVAPLERFKAVRGFGHLEPTAIFFTREPMHSHSHSQSTIDFSSVGRAVLHITTVPGTAARDVHIHAVTCKSLHIGCGMAGTKSIK
jgi:hypothetical protein